MPNRFNPGCNCCSCNECQTGGGGNIQIDIAGVANTTSSTCIDCTDANQTYIVPRTGTLPLGGAADCSWHTVTLNDGLCAHTHVIENTILCEMQAYIGPDGDADEGTLIVIFGDTATHCEDAAATPDRATFSLVLGTSVPVDCTTLDGADLPMDLSQNHQCDMSAATCTVTL